MPTSPAPSQIRRKRLFQLLGDAEAAGTTFARLSEIDGFVEAGRPAFILKHDVHGVPLPALLEFAEAERSMGIPGTYFFMAPDHPLTRPAYDFAAQAEAMRAVVAMGHEVGAHLDPYFLMSHCGQSLADVMKDVLARFAGAGVPARFGNMHGNSRHKMPDRDGFGTSFDLFDEIGRQPDHPALAAVPEETAELIRTSRVRLRDLGFTHWADMPLWSSAYGFIVTNFVTDNRLARDGTVEILVHPETRGHYKLADRQPPGSRTPATTRALVPCPAAGDAGAATDPEPGSVVIAFGDEEFERRFRALHSHPVLFLIHPEHYC